MRDRSVEFKPLQAVKRHRPPLTIGLLPVERGVPTSHLLGCPSVGQPEGGIFISTVVHEVDPLPVGNQALCELERLGVDSMLRPLAVEGKAFAVKAHLDQAAFEGLKLGVSCPFYVPNQTVRPTICGPKGVLREQVKDVCEKKFLMLLLMIAAEFDEIENVS
ncbi:hypothetical protein D9M72_538380 [compost metagenome]